MEEFMFKTVFFGGFNKQNVIKYVSEVVSKFEEEISNLKKDYEKKLAEKDGEILAKQTKCDMFSVELQNLKVELNKNKEQFNLIIENKDSSLRLKDETIAKLEEKVKSLEAQVDEFKSENSNIEMKVKRTEDAAKERISKTIEQARVKIKKEYKTHLENMDLGRKVLINKAIGEASNIVNSAADRAKKITNEAKEEVEEFVKSAKNESSEILNFTNSMVDKILKESIENMFKERVFSGLEKRDIVINFDCKTLENEIEKDVLAASKTLEECGLKCGNFGVDSNENRVKSMNLKNDETLGEDLAEKSQQDES